MPFKKGQSGNKNGNSKDQFKIRSYFTIQEIEKLVEKAKKMAENDPHMMKFLLEQIMGKAPQTMELSGNPDKPLGVVMLPNKNAYESTYILETKPEAGNSTFQS